MDDPNDTGEKDSTVEIISTTEKNEEASTTLEPVSHLGMISDPDLFDIAWSDEMQCIMLVFPTEEKTMFLGFQEGAAEKFLTGTAVLLKLLFGTGMIEREGDQSFEVPEKKNPTLH